MFANAAIIDGLGILLSRRSGSGLFAGHVLERYLPLQSTTSEHPAGATEEDIHALVDKVGEIVTECRGESEKKNDSRKLTRRSSQTLLIIILFQRGFSKAEV